MFLEKKLKVDLQSAKNTLVFIDDAQSSYYDDNLWSSFKTLESDSAMFILLSSYGSAGKYPAVVSTGTPPIFTPEQRISLHKEQHPGCKPIGILLEKDEVEDLVSRFLENQSNGPHLEEGLTAYIRLISGGHAGALAGLLETVVWDPASIPFLSAEYFISLTISILVDTGKVCEEWVTVFYQFGRFRRGVPSRANFKTSTKGLKDQKVRARASSTRRRSKRSKYRGLS